MVDNDQLPSFVDGHPPDLEKRTKRPQPSTCELFPEPTNTYSFPFEICLTTLLMPMNRLFSALCQTATRLGGCGWSADPTICTKCYESETKASPGTRA